MAAILKVDDLTKAFGGLYALNSLSFEVQAGDILGVIGPNGSGKTTLIDVICGVYKPTRGRIIFNGEQIENLPSHRVIRHGLARSFQLTQSFASFNLVDFVTFSALCRVGLKQARKDADKVLEKLKLEGKGEESVINLTPADQKLAELGRVINSGAKMLCLDEIMAGLVEADTELVYSVVRELNSKGTTVLLIEHRLEVIRELCHQTMVLNFGQKIAEGKPLEVMANREVIRAYVGEED
jgi:ABC-type branched-subunit amino acid transport system ATPase component